MKVLFQLSKRACVFIGSHNKHISYCESQSKGLKNTLWDFPGGPVVKNPPSSAGDLCSIPGQGTKTPQLLRPTALEPVRHN